MEGTAIQIAVTVESAIGLMLESTVLVILVCSKAYKTFLQRLFVWIVVAFIVTDTTRVTTFAHGEEEMPGEVCEMLAFCQLWSWWSVYMFLTVIIVFLFVKVYIQTRDNPTAISANLKNSIPLRMGLEIGIVLVSLTLPMTVLWFPFQNDLYAHNGIRCHLNSSSDLPKEFKIMNGIIQYAPQNLAGFIAIVAALGLMMQYHTLRQHKVARQLIKKLILSLSLVTFFSVADNVMTVLRKL